MDMEPAVQLSYAPTVPPSLDATLRSQFGLERFHPWQRDAIDELLTGRQQVLLVAPTGGGKSLVYQLPAVVLEGTTVVVSPLIALMDDQVRSLTERGIPATYLASTLSYQERQAREQGVREGRYRMVYVAPERLAADAAVAMLARLAPPLVAIDEAHCIAQWGHDFRPDYLRLGRVVEALRPCRVLACTATATPAVRDEIMHRLGLHREDTAVVLRGFARPNLHLAAEELDRLATRREVCLATLRQTIGPPREPRGAAIIYAGTRKNTERLATVVAGKGWRAAPYHAGLEASSRDRTSRDFALRNLDVVVATNAFGMGIDRSDIRAVIHLQAPGSIEQYYQEVGRAGRDGQPAHGLLLSGSSDYGLRRRLIEGSHGERAEPLPERTQWQWQLFLDLMRYVEAGSCRHDFILRYFGDEQETLGGCGHCDVCERLEAQKGPGVLPEEEVTLLVRQALSGIARNRGRAGLTAVAGMLQGATTRQLQRLGLTRLSTHGLLADYRPEWIVALLRRLLTAGLIDVTAARFPIPRLTARGRATMMGELPVRVLLPPENAGRKRSAPKTKRGEAAVPTNIIAHPALYESLRTERLAMAREQGVPAYLVCPNRTLVEISARRPASLDELGEVHGMGPARIEAYGLRLLAVVHASL